MITGVLFWAVLAYILFAPRDSATTTMIGNWFVKGLILYLVVVVWYALVDSSKSGLKRASDYFKDHFNH